MIMPINYLHKKIELAVIATGVILVFITLLTYILGQQKSNWVCGPVLLIVETIAIGMQILFSVITWKSRNRRIKIFMLCLSIGLLIFISRAFINFNLNCS